MNQHYPHFSKNQGLSLIEMMVSMVLGLFLVGGLSITYLNTRENDKVRQAVTEMEANARMAMEYLNQGIQHAGYRSIYIIPMDKPFLSEKDGTAPNTICRGGGTANNVLLTTPTNIKYSEDGSGSASDQITSIFMSDNPDDALNVTNRRRIFTDCAGGQITDVCSADPKNGMPDPMTSKIYNSFYIDTNKLVCVGSRTAGSTPIEIADNIVNMQIRYGVASDDQIRYEKADKVEDDENWRKVKSVQVALLIRSSKNVLKQAETRSFELLDQTIAVENAHKMKLHRVYSTTIHLENRI